MSALIKPGSSSLVRAFAGKPQVPERPILAVDPDEAERAALRSEIEHLTRALADAQVNVDKLSAKAREEGRAAGLAEAASRGDEHLQSLRDALSAAVDTFGERLELLESLAPAMVRAALAKLFDSPERWSEMSEAMLTRQIRLLRRSSVISVRVSPKDFPDAAALDRLGLDELQIILDSELRAGACRIQCRLGEIDLDARQQWAALAGLLEAMEAA